MRFSLASQLSRISVVLAPAAVGAGFFAASRLPRLAEAHRMTALVAIFALTTLVVAAAAVLVVRAAGSFRERLHLAAAPPLLCATAYGFLLLVEGSHGRYALTALVMALVAAHLSFVRGMLASGGRFRPEDLPHLVHALHVISSFFLLSFVFGIAAFAPLPRYASAPLVGAFVFFIAIDMLWHAGLAPGRRPHVAAALGMLAAELSLALSFLPTSYLVNAAVGVILFASGLHIAKQALSGAERPPALRRHLALSFTMVVVVLLTARWI